ncbi:MAG: hypothetical protein R8G66_23035 [Cytophagales bacterium]|nr:hypothetical protein [Cytophagales bacterium]
MNDFELYKLLLDNVRNISQQYITLSTGILAISISLIDKVKSTNANQLFVRIGWIGYMVSILFGIWTLYSITGTVQKGIEVRSNIIIPQHIQAITFFISTIFIVLYGTQLLNARKKDPIKEGEKTLTNDKLNEQTEL